jgi:hypothetical protein
MRVFPLKLKNNLRKFATIFYYFPVFSLTVSLTVDFIGGELSRQLLGCELAVRETRGQMMDGAPVALCRRDGRRISTEWFGCGRQKAW